MKALMYWAVAALWAAAVLALMVYSFTLSEPAGPALFFGTLIGGGVVGGVVLGLAIGETTEWGHR